MVFNDFYIILYGFGRFLMIFIHFWIIFWQTITKMAPIHRKSMKICADRSPDQIETFFKVENGQKCKQISKNIPFLFHFLYILGGRSADWAEPIRFFFCFLLGFPIDPEVSVSYLEGSRTASGAEQDTIWGGSSNGL